MLDRPEARAVLAQVHAALKAGIGPGFHQAVAANAVELVLREDEMAQFNHLAERVRLNALLGREGTLEELNHALAQGIASGAVEAAQSEVAAHLIATAIEKMMVDQPNYPAFRAWRDERP